MVENGLRQIHFCDFGVGGVFGQGQLEKSNARVWRTLIHGIEKVTFAHQNF